MTTFDETSLEGSDKATSLTNLNKAPQLQQQRSEMLCMIGIPANITCNELLDLVMPFKYLKLTLLISSS